MSSATPLDYIKLATFILTIVVISTTIAQSHIIINDEDHADEKQDEKKKKRRKDFAISILVISCILLLFVLYNMACMIPILKSYIYCNKFENIGNNLQTNVSKLSKFTFN